jgi:hypothetical protein
MHGPGREFGTCTGREFGTCTGRAARGQASCGAAWWAARLRARRGPPSSRRGGGGHAVQTLPPPMPSRCCLPSSGRARPPHSAQALPPQHNWRRRCCAARWGRGGGFSRDAGAGPARPRFESSPRPHRRTAPRGQGNPPARCFGPGPPSPTHRPPVPLPGRSPRASESESSGLDGSSDPLLSRPAFATAAPRGLGASGPAPRDRRPSRYPRPPRDSRRSACPLRTGCTGSGLRGLGRAAGLGARRGATHPDLRTDSDSHFETGTSR